MTSNECAMFKVFLKTNDTTEVKKFVVDDSTVITSFLFMKEKLQTLFPILREVNFRITWRDSEGDDVIIDSDEDLILAFTEMESSLKILYVTVLPHTQQFSPPQYGYPPSRIVCDSCNNEITTYRYKCLQCFDYDLCSNCEHAGNHAHHMMLRTSTPELPLARCGRKIFEQVNKAVKKANHMAYKDCKRRSKWDNKKKADGNDAGGEEPCKKDARTSSGCPFEDYAPQFYPFIDAISNAANAAASAAAHAATTAASAAGGTNAQPSASAQATNSEQTGAAHDMNNPTSHFIEAIRSALSGVFVQQPTSQGTAQPTATQPTATQTQSQPNAPPATAEEVDLLTPPEPMDVSSAQREPGWTILSPEEPATKPQTPVSTPIVTPQQPPHVVPNPTPAQQPPQQAQYPVLNVPAFLAAQQQDPQIAQGLRQLLEMGFSDEQALISLLKRYHGNVDEVIKYIFERK